MNEQYDNAELDITLIEQSKTGNETAFETIVDRYRRRVLTYCHRMVRHESLAEDLAQEVFVRFYQALPRIDTRKAVVSYLFRIAHNRCLDWLRTRRPQMQTLTRTEDDDQPTVQLPDARPTPEEEVLRGELLEAVEKALAAVPPRYRSVLVMRHVEELSYEEIAEALGLPMGTVKARIHRGREKLQQELRDFVNL
ncbi:MAG: sigma-70 family RNA polymerase sigma factor [Vicinamibacteria bacterium]|nr:sigma-70 family RNA polymerase sigma factor [Vicinamibacteria bacterium]